MLRSVLLITALAVTSGSYAQQWVKVWSDEFNTPGLPDTSKWSQEVGLIRNNELQYYTNRRIQNAHIDDTTLIIEAIQESYLGSSYTSASLLSRFKGDWLYGRMDVKAKIPTGKGSWPAIWMLPSDNIHGGWPFSGEIDIMENVGYEPDNIYATAHFYGTDGSGHQSSGNHTSRTTPYDKFYTYSVEWSPDQIDWFIDGVKVHSYSRTAGMDYRLWPFNERFYLILNLAIGGTWGGIQGVDPNIFPLKYYIDFVRIYKWQTDAGPYTLTIEPSVGGTVEALPQQADYTAGTTVQLAATPDANYYFAGFFYMGYANPLTVQMVEDKTVIPVFYKIGELIKNGTFDRGITGWNNLYISNTATQAARAGWKDGVYVFEITKPATEWWNLGDQWLGIPAIQGKTYRVTFDAWADNANKIGLSFSRNYGNYAAYYENPEINMGLTRSTYTWEFTFNAASDNNCRLYFGMGRFNGQVYLDNISMTAVNLNPVDDAAEPGEPAIKVGTEPASGNLYIALSRTQPGHVNLAVCNLQGMVLTTLYNGTMTDGEQTLNTTIDKTRLPAGIYLLQYKTPEGMSYTKFPVY